MIQLIDAQESLPATGTKEPNVPTVDIARVDELVELDTICQWMESNSSLPRRLPVMLEVIAASRQSSRAMARAVEADPELARLVRHAARCLHPGGDRWPYRSTQEALEVLGHKSVMEIAVRHAFASFFQPMDGKGMRLRRRIWLHMVAVATTSRKIAEDLGMPDPDQAFAAGLLHDLGLVIEALYLCRRFCEVVDHLPQHASLQEAEQHMLGFDHTMLGEVAARRWNLPRAIQKVILEHHDRLDQRDEGHKLADVVALADQLSMDVGLASVPGQASCRSEMLKRAERLRLTGKRFYIRHCRRKMLELFHQHLTLLDFPHAA